VVDVYVRYLRHKLGQDRIQTIRGVGYRLVCLPGPTTTAPGEASGTGDDAEGHSI
jgi:hypothetical protein